MSRNNVRPPVADQLTQDEIGRAYGFQALLRQELLRGFFGWITYSLTRSERQDHPNTAWRLFDFDQTQALGVVASYQLGHGWDLGLRFRYTTGFPRTPVVNSYQDFVTGQYNPIFGPYNSIRIPSFYQLDARLERCVRLPAGEDERLPRRPEPHRPAEPGGDHLQLQLPGAVLHHRLPDAGRAGRPGGVDEETVPALAALLLLSALAGGCKPDLGTPQSLIIGPTILAIRGRRRSRGGGMAAYDALTVDVHGRVAAPEINWALCIEPIPRPTATTSPTPA